MPQVPDAVRAELAPGGRLRAALNYSNTLLISSKAPEPTGVAPDLARELARRMGTLVEFVGYANAGLAADAAANDEWDVAFIGAEPQRAGEITFSPAYVEIEASYLVPAGSSLLRIDDVDRSGVHIATAARAAYTLFLQRTLRHAALVEAEGLPGAVDRFVETEAGCTGRVEAEPDRRRAQDPRVAGARRSLHRRSAINRRAQEAGRGCSVSGGICVRDHLVRVAARSRDAPPH